MKSFSVIVIALAMLVCIGIGSAAVLTPATNETQTITTDTAITCNGIVMSSDNYATQNSNQALDKAPLAAKEEYVAAGYTSQVIALNGYTQFVKTLDLNTKNQVITGSNIDAQTAITYEGADGGVIAGSEDIGQFDAGQAGTKVADKQLCPFGQESDSVIPPYNEAVQMGSDFILYNGNVNTQAGAVTTAKTADVPSQTDYVVDVTGTGQVSAYMNVFAQDARGTGSVQVAPKTTTTIPGKTVTTKVTTKGYWDGCHYVPEKTTTTTTTTKDQTVTTPAVYATVPSSQVSYTDTSSAIGTFDFHKKYSYVSGIVG